MRDFDVPPLVRAIAERCHQQGGTAWLVGGSVRDHLMGLPIKDWDLEVHGIGVDELEALLRHHGRVDAVGRAFSVFKLHKHGVEYDISIPRRDSKAGPGHRGIEATGDPTLSPKEAARRRDLTVNAIMLDVRTGEICDPWHGQRDIEARVLRPVDHDTFLEDPLRALRAVQFMARLDFRASPELSALCIAAALDELPEERVLLEWAKLLVKGRAIAQAMRFARDTRILSRVFPEHPHAPERDDALDRAVPHRDLLHEEGPKLALMGAVWLARLPAGVAGATADRLKLFRWFGHNTRDILLAAAAHVDDPIATDADLRWLSTRAHVETTLYARDALDGLDDLSGRLARAAALGVLHEAPRPLLQGRDLKGMLAPGPAMGRVLKAVYALQMDGAVTTDEEARAEARAWIDREAG